MRYILTLNLNLFTSRAGSDSICTKRHFHFQLSRKATSDRVESWSLKSKQVSITRWKTKQGPELVCRSWYNPYFESYVFLLKSSAIIGAGIGGTTCAYFLNENFKGQADVTLFEMGPVGGRLATVTMGGVAFEAGGAVIHPANKLMTHLLEVTGMYMCLVINFSISFIHPGLEPARDAKYLRGWKLNRYSMYESDSVIFKESRWSIVALFQLIWRYGFFVLYRSHRLISRMVRDFARFKTCMIKVRTPYHL